MENWKQTTIVGLVTIIAVLCVFQAGCSEPCDCSDAISTAIKAERSVANQVISGLQKSGASPAVTETVPGAEVKVPELFCDTTLLGDLSHCMDYGSCPFDPQKTAPFRILTAEEKLRMSYSHVVEWATESCRHQLKTVADCEDGKWKQYSKEQVQAQLDCLMTDYYATYKAILTYSKPLGMYFAAHYDQGEDSGYGYSPALRAVLEIMAEFMEEEVDPKVSGIMPELAVAAYQLRFKEALDFLATRSEEQRLDKDGVLEGDLCALVTDFNLYNLYPDPLKGVTRAEMAKRLKCESSN